MTDTDTGAAASAGAGPGATAPLRVALRTDASAAIGTGHLRRCLALAEALVTQCADVCFVVRRLDTVAEGVLRGSPYPVHWLPAAPASSRLEAEDPVGPPHRAWAGVTWNVDAAQTAAALRAQPPQWLVVDHYALDARWHDALRAALGCRLLVVDDVADRPLSPDLLLDHNWAPDHRAKYAGRLQREPTAWLTGPRFALLSAAYRHAPRYVFNPQVRSIGVFMGGTDPCGASAQVLRCLREQVGFAGPVEVASTSANPQLPELRNACAALPNTTLTLDLPDLAAFFARHDLQIGAGGGATWERCCIGAPSIAVCLAVNQHSVLDPLSVLRVLVVATLLTQGNESLSFVVENAIENRELRASLFENCMRLVDGRGIHRVTEAILTP